MSSNPTIEQMNVVLARFEGRMWLRKYTIDDYGPEKHTFYPEMKYHESWDWLMPCWKKAGQILYAIRREIDGEKYIEATRITKDFLSACQKAEVLRAHEAVYYAVQLIQWYNKQKDNG
jgi:hypothetical protein